MQGVPVVRTTHSTPSNSQDRAAPTYNFSVTSNREQTSNTTLWDRRLDTTGAKPDEYSVKIRHEDYRRWGLNLPELLLNVYVAKSGFRLLNGCATKFAVQPNESMSGIWYSYLRVTFGIWPFYCFVEVIYIFLLYLIREMPIFLLIGRRCACDQETTSEKTNSVMFDLRSAPYDLYSSALAVSTLHISTIYFPCLIDLKKIPGRPMCHRGHSTICCGVDLKHAAHELVFLFARDQCALYVKIGNGWSSA